MLQAYQLAGVTVYILKNRDESVDVKATVHRHSRLSGVAMTGKLEGMTEPVVMVIEVRRA
jgi:hypothetical protein